MSKNSQGSLGYQMMKALQGIFQPGASRHTAKRRHRDAELITGISTMRCMSADVHQFARFIRINWPEVKHLSEVRQEMALAYIEELKQRERSGGRIARVCASIRKLDTACRKASIFSKEAPPLLPYKDQGGPGGFHSKPKPIPYTEAEAQAIIAYIAPQDPIAAKLLRVMWASGMRISEATWLRVQDIDLANGMISLNQEGNKNHTKGGKPRKFPYSPGAQEFMTVLKRSPNIQPTGWDCRIKQEGWSARLVVNWASSHWGPTVFAKRSAWRNTTAPGRGEPMTGRHCWKHRSSWGTTGSM